METELVVILVLQLMLIALVLILGDRWEIIVVRGDSMLPTLNDGDFVLIDKKPKAYSMGDICVLIPPDDDNKIVIKRITKIMGLDIHNGKSNTNFWFLGDNRNNSYDSREYGWVKEELIEGRVIKQWKKKRK